MYSTASIGGLAVDALNQAGRPWFVACSSETLSGLQAAVMADLGVTAQSRMLLQQKGLVELPTQAGLPELAEIEAGRSRRLQGPVADLADALSTSSLGA